MKSLSSHIIPCLNRFIAAITVCLMMAACSNSNNDDDLGVNDVRVAFSLSVADATQTRAVNDGWDDYDPSIEGTGYENLINSNDIMIKICDRSGNAIADVEDLHVTPVNDINGTRYDITGTWKEAKALLERASKVMVIANCNAGDKNMEPLSELSFSIGSYNKKYIPMWGVAPLPKLTLGSNNKLPESISMLRAMAKVSVRLRNDMITNYGYSISNIKICRYNTAGYCLPNSYEDAMRTTDIKFANSLHAFSSMAESLDFSTTGVVYLPEYDNTSGDANPSTIGVTLTRNGKPEGTYTLYFRNYDSDGAPTGMPYDIQRNHYYQYTIYKESDKIIVTLHVRKWNPREYGEDIIM